MHPENIQSSFIKSFRSSTPIRTWCTNLALLDDSCWTLELRIKEASKFNSRENWEKSSPISYKKAIARGWLTKCTTHIKDFQRKPAVPSRWTLERCLEVAKLCQRRAEFKEKFHYPYEKARLNGLLDICCAHMN